MLRIPAPQEFEIINALFEHSFNFNFVKRLSGLYVIRV